MAKQTLVSMGDKIKQAEAAVSKQPTDKQPTALLIAVAKVNDEYIGQTSITSMSMKNSHRNLQIDVMFKEPKDGAKWETHKEVHGENNLYLQREVNKAIGEILQKTGYLA